MSTLANPKAAANRRQDWVFALAEPGAVVSLSFSEEPRPRSARAVVFMDTGETYWFDSVAVGRPRSFELAAFATAGHDQLRFATKVSELREPAELVEGEGDAPVGRVPLILDVTLAPLARVVVLADATAPADQVPTQGFRATGTLAVGSVIHRVDGQAWAGASGFSAPGNESATRVQAIFQDDSSLTATTAAQGPTDRTAALQVHNRISRFAVRSLVVDGRDRGVPLLLAGELEGEASFELSGAPRHVEGYQHVAFLRPSTTPGRWVRVGYTPYDLVRSGVTGFGLLEHVVTVHTLAEPMREPGLPDPWD